MPKPLTPEQFHGLHNNGVVISDLSPDYGPNTTNLPAGSIQRALGDSGLPNTEVVGRLDDAQTNESFGWAPGSAAYERTRRLLRLVQADLPIPEFDSPELSHINWQHLQFTSEAYKRINILAEVVVNPEGLPLDFWRFLYWSLRKWQDSNDPSNEYRLRRRDNGDALDIHSELAANWDKVTNTNQLRWSATVIPIPTDAPVMNINYDGRSQITNKIPQDLTKILGALPGNKLIHPSTESYLMMQASRIKAGQQPIDTSTGHTNKWSWLDGEFNGESSVLAPIARWANGQIHLNRGGFGAIAGFDVVSAPSRPNSLGGRPSGRG